MTHEPFKLEEEFSIPLGDDIGPSPKIMYSLQNGEPFTNFPASLSVSLTPQHTTVSANITFIGVDEKQDKECYHFT